MLERKRENKTKYLEIKYFSLWQSLTEPVDGCDTEMPTNPKTGEKVTKYGYKYEQLTGFARKLEWYDTEQKYDQRYLGFKLTIQDHRDNVAVLDIPYKSAFFTRFAKCAANFDWSKEFELRVWRAFNRERNADETAFGLKQDGQKIPVFFSRDNPSGMPEPDIDEVTGKSDYRRVNTFFAKYLKDTVAPMIEQALTVQPIGIKPHHENQEDNYSSDDDFADEPKGAHVNTRRDPQGSGEASKRGESRKVAPVDDDEDEVPF